MGYSKNKKKKRKDGMPKKHDPKKKKKRKNGHNNVHEKREGKKIYIAMSSCYPNKGEGDS